MGKLNRDNKGFGGVELLMLIVIIVLLGVVGWYVYKHDNKTTTLTKTVTVTKLATMANPYTGWIVGSLPSDKMTFKYPSDWKLSGSSTLNPCTNQESDLYTLTAPDGNSMSFKTGFSCGGAGPMLSAGSIPINSYETGLFLSYFENTTDGVIGMSISSQDLSSGQSGSYFAGPSRNVGGTNAFSFTYSGKSNLTLSQFKVLPDYNDAKLVLESLSY